MFQAQITEKHSTYTGQSDPAVTAFRLSGGFFEVVIDQLSPGCLYNAATIGGGVIRCTFAKCNALGHYRRMVG